MSPCYYPTPVPCFGAIPMVPVSDFDEEMRPIKPMTHSISKPKMDSSDFEKAPGSPTDLDTQYTQGYLKTQIGKKVKIVFLIGTDLVQDKEGTLIDVGISYIIIKEGDINTSLLCDIYSIIFITFYS